MNLSEAVDLLNYDLANEYSHMMFYTVHSSTLLGAHRRVFSEFFENHAKSEMAHAMKFQDLIVGLGGVPVPTINPVPVHADAEAALKHAINMEQEVVNNYVKQLVDLEKLSEGPDPNSADNLSLRLRVKLFLERQFEDSRHDLEELKNLVFAFKG